MNTYIDPRWIDIMMSIHLSTFYYFTHCLWKLYFRCFSTSAVLPCSSWLVNICGCYLRICCTPHYIISHIWPTYIRSLPQIYSNICLVNNNTLIEKLLKQHKFHVCTILWCEHMPEFIWSCSQSINGQK